MELNEVKQRLEHALRPVEKPPSIEEVLEQVSRRGVLRGPVDWVFPAWMLYVEYAAQKIIKTFQLSEEEKRQLLDFRDAMKRLLLEAQRQAKGKLTTLYKAVVEGTYRMEGKETVRPRRSVDGCKRGLRIAHYTAHYNPRRKRLGAFSRRVEASAGEA
jgi:hypothetical protein